MSKIRNAWLALAGKLEPEVREVKVPVVGEANVVSLYRVYVPDETGGKCTTFSGGLIWMKRDAVYFTTCEQAHATHPELGVVRVDAIRAGNTYFVGDVKAVDVQPKPKRPKGRAR